MGRGTLEEVRNGSGDRWGGSGWFVGPSGRYGTGQRTLGEVRDGSETLEEVRHGRETLGEVRDGFREPSGRSGTGRGTIGEVRDGSGDPGEVQDGSGDRWGGPGWVLGPSGRFGTVC